MEIQLQELIDQIKKEGVQTAENEADAIINSAKAEAEKIIQNAKAQAEEILQNAKSENERMVKSGEEAIRQAGRNLLISFRESITKELKAIVSENVCNVYSSDDFAKLIITAVESWSAKPDADDITVILNSEDLSKLEETVMVGLKDKMLNGVTLKDVLIKRGKPFTFKEIRWMLQPVFQLLNEMSKLNIHHGGISDETIIVTPDNTVVLTGFAIQDLRTKNEHVAYKLFDGFSAPEQYFSNRFQGSYTDVYALACLVYFSVTGKFLDKAVFEGKDIYRVFPKHAVEALKYATAESQKERLDKISDFVMMLDDKGTVVKSSQPAKTKEKDVKKLAMYGAIAVVFVHM